MGILTRGGRLLERSVGRLTSELAHAGRALRYRNYRIFFAGQGISLIGTWMQMTILGWMVYQITESNARVGQVNFWGQIPIPLLAPLGGVLADRLDRRRVLIVTQTLAMCQAFVLGALFVMGAITVVQITVLAVLLGVINGFDMPTRQAFVFDLIERKEDFGNAIALNSMMFNGARLVGPPIAGLVTGKILGAVLSPNGAAGVCFLINAITYLAVIVSFFFMAPPKSRAARPRRHLLHELVEGFAYAARFAPVRSVLLLLSLVSLLGMPYAVLMPYFARDVFGGGAATLGLLYASAGVGSLVGALYLASRRSVVGLAQRIPVAMSVFGLALVGFGLSSTLWVSILLLAAAGCGMMITMAGSNTVIQTVVDDDKRGRVMSAFTIAFMGTMAFGSLVAGTLAQVPSVGPHKTVFYAGTLAVLGAAVFTLRLPALLRAVHPAYARRGVIVPGTGNGNALAPGASLPPPGPPPLARRRKD